MATNCPDYNFSEIESTWQKYWDESKTFRTPNDTNKEKFFVLDMFPYPSGAGLHVGHPLGYIATDIFARFKRMRGFNVLHTMGFDAFGLPAEQYAVEHGIHPSVSTNQNIESMQRQLYQLGLGHDRTRAVSTTDATFYRWTQWIFLQIFNAHYDPFENKAKTIASLSEKLEAGSYAANFETNSLEKASDASVAVQEWKSASSKEQLAFIDSQRLAYLAEVPVNWCPALGTVLANEEVTNEGRSERGNHPVFKRPLKQWMLRITKYCERLIADLEGLDWPEPIKLMQRNWIGRSEGAEIVFSIDGHANEALEVFTTRPDTLFGATYMVIAPEHPLVSTLTTHDQKDAVGAYVKKAANKSDLERTDLAKDKSGEFTGAFAINPINGNGIPIWIADYVLMSYGTGAIMAVPAHDSRDFEFAQVKNIPIVQVIEPVDGSECELPFCDHGKMLNSNEFSGLPSKEGGRKVTEKLASQGVGRATVNYKLRDWLFSRQRYWGEPFPILHGDDGEIIGVPEGQLPVELPEMEDFSPQSYSDPNTPPTPPLGRSDDSWQKMQYNGRTWQRELNTMPQWAGSCWYYLRYIDPQNENSFVDPSLEKYWMGGNGVDLYVGGAEHAVLHLLYSRFWHKVLFDLEKVSTKEPFGKLFNQGYIQAYCYRDSRGIAVPATEVVNSEGRLASEVQGNDGENFFYNNEPVTEEYGKMGKSLKNAIAPDDVCRQYGADTLRLYLMFLGPLEAMKPWSSTGIDGISRFLKRVWREFIGADGELSSKYTEVPEDDSQTLRLLNETIKKVTEDCEALRFNTAISQLMIMLNHLQKIDAASRETLSTFIQLLCPLAPHICEEIWQRSGNSTSVCLSGWPSVDESKLVVDEARIVFQVNGKLRGQAMVSKTATQDEILELAKAEPKVQAQIEGKTIRKVIFVPGKILNIVAN